MCRVTSTELKNNLSYYLELSNKEDVCVTTNGKIISVLTNPRDRNYIEFKKLKGCFSEYYDGKDYKESLSEEIAKKCGY